MIELRPYQQAIKDDVRSSLSKHKGVCVYGPTGSGKTRIFCSIASDAINKGSIVWILVNRIELLLSAKNALNELGIQPELLYPENEKFDQTAPIVIAMVQTLKRRSFADLDKVKLLITDECHLTDFDNQYERFPNAFRLGFSATPKRKGRQNQLTQFFTKLVKRISIKELIQDGYLVPAKEYTFNVVSTKNIPKKGDDFDDIYMYGEFDKNIVYEGAVNNWKRICPGVRTLVFCVNIDHAKKMTQAFCDEGVQAKYIVSYGMDQKRDVVLDEWERNEFPVLVNASIFTTGFDSPSLRCVILCRATESENLYRQMIGRGARKHPGKEFFYVLDLGENIDRHGQYAIDKEYFLHHKKRDTIGAPVMKECPSCNSYIMGSAKTCKYCGYVYPLTAKEKVEIELAEIRKVDISTVDVTDLAKLDLIRRARSYKPSWVAVQLAMKAPNQFADLIKSYGRAKQYKESWAHQMILKYSYLCHAEKK